MVVKEAKLFDKIFLVVQSLNVCSDHSRVKPPLMHYRGTGVLPLQLVEVLMSSLTALQ